MLNFICGHLVLDIKRIPIRTCEVLGTLEWSIVHLIFAPILMQACVEGLCVGWECNILLLDAVFPNCPCCTLKISVLGYHPVLFYEVVWLLRKRGKRAHCAKCKVFGCCSSIVAFCLRNFVVGSTLWK